MRDKSSIKESEENMGINRNIEDSKTKFASGYLPHRSKPILQLKGLPTHFSTARSNSNVGIVSISQPIQRCKRIIPPICYSPILHHIRSRLSNFISPNLGNPSNGRIDSSTDPRGSPDIPIFDPTGSSYPFDVRSEGCGLRPCSFVRCCVSAVKNTRSCCYTCAFVPPDQLLKTWEWCLSGRVYRYKP